MITAAQIKKYNSKSVPELLKLAERAFNKFIRERDSEDGWFKCISCGRYKSVSDMHASHYMSAGNYSATRFNEFNVNGACSKCNVFLHGNLIEYRIRLVEKIGEENVRAIETVARSRHKFERTGLIWIILTYKDKLKNERC